MLNRFHPIGVVLVLIVAAGFENGCSCVAVEESSLSSTPASNDPTSNDDPTSNAPISNDPTPNEGPVVYVQSPYALYSLSAADADLKLIGYFDVDATITDIAVSFSGDIVGVSYDGLYEIDKNTGAARLINTLSFVDEDGTGNFNTLVGLTYLPDGRLIGGDRQGFLYDIDQQSGVLTQNQTLNDGYSTGGDLIAVSDGTVYLFADAGPLGNEGTNNALLKIDLTTGDMTAVGSIGFDSVYGCAYLDGAVIAFTNNGDVIKVNRDTGEGILIRHHENIQFYGAGVTPTISID